MKSLKRNLPNEHGGWVLLVVSIAVGLLANPGPWQAAAVTGWLGVFLVRVPLARLADGKRSRTEWSLTILTGTMAIVGFGLLLEPRPHSMVWVGVAAIPGAVLVLLRKRRWLRSMAGEMLAMVAMSPMLPSIVRAGDRAMTVPQSTSLAAAMALYLVCSVLRVRAVARLGRNRAPGWLRLAGAWTWPAVIGLSVATGWWSAQLAGLAAPAALAGLAMVWRARRERIGLYWVGGFETAVVIPFAVGIARAFAGT